MQCLTMVAPTVVHRRVADPTQVVKHRPLRRTDGAAVRKPINQLLLALLWGNVQSNLGGRALRQHFTELA